MTGLLFSESVSDFRSAACLIINDAFSPVVFDQVVHITPDSDFGKTCFFRKDFAADRILILSRDVGQKTFKRRVLDAFFRLFDDRFGRGRGFSR